MRALVTSARSPHALTAIRELGRRGWQVVAADNTRLSCGLYSRHVQQRLLMPNVTDDPAGWQAALVEQVERQEIDLVLPTFEEVFLVAGVRDAVSQRAEVVVHDRDALLGMHHKMRLVHSAAQAGLEVPACWQPADLLALRELAATLQFPVVVKLVDGNNSLGLAEADNPTQLEQVWKRLVDFYGLAGERMPVVQRKIMGEVLFTLALAWHGEFLGQVLYEPVRMFPDSGGTAFERRCVRHPAVEAAGERLITEHKWHGFLGLDFIIDPDTGVPLLIDANPRPSPALGLAQKSGVDFIGMIDDLVAGRKPRAARPQAGRVSRTLFVYLLWSVSMLLPGRRWWHRVRRVVASLLEPTPLADIHDPRDRLPSVVMAVYVPYFMFVVNTLRPRSGGFMFGCNYDLGESDPP